MFIDVNGKINAISAFNDIPNNSAKEPAHDQTKKKKKDNKRNTEKKILGLHTPALDLPRLSPPRPPFRRSFPPPFQGPGKGVF